MTRTLYTCLAFLAVGALASVACSFAIAISTTWGSFREQSRELTPHEQLALLQRAPEPIHDVSDSIWIRRNFVGRDMTFAGCVSNHRRIAATIVRVAGRFDRSRAHSDCTPHP